MDISLEGKTALVTGAGSGIGRGVIEMLSSAGAEIIGCGRTAAEKLNLPEGCSYFQCDVTKKEDIENMTDQIRSRLSRLDILFSNAGVNIFRGAEFCSDDDWAFNIKLNLESHWRISKELLPLLKKGDNPVIQIMSSNHGYKTMKGCFPYNVTKTALLGLVRSMALDFAPEVRVVGLAPGFIQTEGADRWFNSFDNPAAERERTENLHPLKALGTVDQIGGFAVFLSSAYASFMTGETIIIDGGRTAVLQDD